MVDKWLLLCGVRIAVQRVVPRKSTTQEFLTPEEALKCLTVEGDVAEHTPMPDAIDKEWRVLSKNIGLVYLGETISFFVACVNESTSEQVVELTVRVDLQTSSRVVMISEQKRDSLIAKDSHVAVLHHEIKEMGGSV